MSEDAQLTACNLSDAQSGETIACLREALHRVHGVNRVIDVGCARGALPRWLAAQGYSAIGLDLNVEPENTKRLALIRWDLTQPVTKLLAPMQAELVLCWEVAEHLPPASADTLCESLSALTIPGGHLLFSAATPGQGGSGHLNEQPQSYWRDKLEDVGFEWDSRLSDDLARAFRKVAPNLSWYSQNIVAMKKWGGPNA